MSFRNTILKAWFSRRARAIDRFRRHPIETQERMFRYLLRRGRMTEFGDRYDLRHIHTVEQFQTQVETFDYDTFKPYVERMLEGIRSVTSPGRVTLFARSSGTTSDRSKYIPRDERLALVEPHAGHARRSDALCGGAPRRRGPSRAKP